MILLPDIILRDFEGFISTTSHAHPYFHRLAVNMFPAHMGYDTPIWRKARGLCWSGLVHTGIQFQFADLHPLSLLYKRILHFEDFGARLNYWYTRVIVCVLTSLIRERERHATCKDHQTLSCWCVKTQLVCLWHPLLNSTSSAWV